MVDRECVCTYDQTNGLPPHHWEGFLTRNTGFYNYYGIYSEIL